MVSIFCFEYLVCFLQILLVTCHLRDPEIRSFYFSQYSDGLEKSS